MRVLPWVGSNTAWEVFILKNVKIVVYLKFRFK